MIKLKEPLLSLWRNKDPFNEVEKLNGEVFRALETRRTLRFEIDKKGYFLKLHYGTTWKEVIKNLASLRLPVLGADREWKAIHRLQKHHIDTMHGVGFGQKGLNPVRRISFIITEDLSPTISLEDYCADWKVSSPPPAIKRMIIERVAMMVRNMHAVGVNHRDCYICHFLLHLPFNGDAENLKISVIDLHRAQLRERVPLRWRNKDLIGLYFSSLDIGLTQRDIFRFLKYYFSMPLRDIQQQEAELLRQAQQKAEKIRVRTINKSL
nr:lipopolysaccharide core heptose(I) kinase RfaP [Pantoea sp. 201603H]